MAALAPLMVLLGMEGMQRVWSSPPPSGVRRGGESAGVGGDEQHGGEGDRLTALGTRTRPEEVVRSCNSMLDVQTDRLAGPSAIPKLTKHGGCVRAPMAWDC